MPDKDKSRTSIRVPSDMLTEVQTTAEREQRSLSNMLVVLISEALKERRKKHQHEEQQSFDAERGTLHLVA